MIEWPSDVVSEDRHTVRRALADAGFNVDTAARAPTRSIAAFVRRAIAGPRYALAVVPAKGSPAHWLVGRVMVELAAGGFVVRRDSRWVLLARCAGAVLAGEGHAVRIGLRARRLSVLPAVEDARRLAPISKSPTAAARGCGLSVVVLSYNRKAALLETLARLREGAASRDAETIVVDNASTDATMQALAEHAPWARTIALDTNEAIAGFNRGVLAASGGVVLILDDDARPDDAALAGAMELLARRADLAAVTMLPGHPATGRSEWPFGEKLGKPRDDWPVMGCCNLVRRDAGEGLGGSGEHGPAAHGRRVVAGMGDAEEVVTQAQGPDDLGGRREQRHDAHQGGRCLGAGDGTTGRPGRGREGSEPRAPGAGRPARVRRA